MNSTFSSAILFFACWMSLLNQDNGFPAHLQSTFTPPRPPDPSPANLFTCRMPHFMLKGSGFQQAPASAHAFRTMRCSSSSDRQQPLNGKREQQARIMRMKRGDLRGAGVVDLRRRAIDVDLYAIPEGGMSLEQTYTPTSAYVQLEAKAYDRAATGPFPSQPWLPADLNLGDSAGSSGQPLERGLSMVFDVMDIEGTGAVSTDTIKDVFMEIG
jgi:hypothetical protein